MNLEYRMYCLVLRQLSGVNKGIQAAHACLEYANEYGNTPAYRKYIDDCKTIIMLDGGMGSDMDEIEKILKDNNINFASFYEPDLNDCLTAICFLADESVWDKKEYPDFEPSGVRILGGFVFCHDTKNKEHWVERIGKKNVILRDILKGKRLSQ